MEHWWNDTDREKPKYPEKKNLFQCHKVHHKSHTEWPGMESKPLRYMAGNFSHPIFGDFRKSISSWDFPQASPVRPSGKSVRTHKKIREEYARNCRKNATIYSLFISVNHSTCFGLYLHPSSGAHVTVSTVSPFVIVTRREREFPSSHDHERRYCGYSDMSS